MGKRDRRNVTSTEKQTNCKDNSIELSGLVEEAAIDPALALLFSTSLGPAKVQRPSQVDSLTDDRHQDEGLHDDITKDSQVHLTSSAKNLSDNILAHNCTESEDKNQFNSKSKRKRKRNIENDDLEEKYMQKLVVEEEKEKEQEIKKKQKRPKLTTSEDPDAPNLNDDELSDLESIDSSEEDAQISQRKLPRAPIHESLAPSQNDDEVEKASRTVFLANVSTLAISSKSSRKILLAHMGSFLASLPPPPEGKPAHKVESLRFRSTAYAGTIPKKAAFAKKELMCATTKSTNAYVVYSTAYAAREAVKKLNGTMVLDRHLRVDGVAHPSKIDHRRCVFVGNLGFVDDESLLDQNGENERKRSKIPSDVEEGLWRQFSKAGVVESVRVVRDEKTRVGKGFAYVQFQDSNSVESALLFNEKKFPPMLPRILRVVRAKAVGKTALAVAASRTNKTQSTTTKARIFNPKVTPEQASLHGRASKLLGRAGAANIKRSGASGANATMIGRQSEQNLFTENSAPRPPQSFVFEGHRASAGARKPSKLKTGSRSGRNVSKSTAKRSKRSSEWKKNGIKKTKQK
ncbi:Nucleolar protein 12 [Podosphaera aphanis]|nr:Nucleolar protein 12 [Podosphaera aphanis]